MVRHPHVRTLSYSLFTYELVVPMDGREGGFIMYEHADNEP